MPPCEIERRLSEAWGLRVQPQAAEALTDYAAERDSLLNIEGLSLP